MQVSRRRAVALLSTAALAGSATTAVSALGHDGSSAEGTRGTPLLTTTLAPSIPTDPTLHGVAPGGAPWVLTRGEAQLHSDGRIQVRIRGLVIPVAPFNGTPGPVTTVDAALYCANDTTAAATTPSVPISRAGNALINSDVSLPSTCQAPVLLINPNGISSIYIATSGFGG